MMRTSAWLVTVVVLAFSSAPAAQQLRVAFDDGTVSIRAVNVPLSVVLAEWARQGGTRIIGADALPATPLNVDLVNVPEREAIGLLLQRVAGFVVVRSGGDRSTRGQSALARLDILPTSTVAPATPWEESLELVAVDPATPESGWRLANNQPRQPSREAPPPRLREGNATPNANRAAPEPPPRLGMPPTSTQPAPRAPAHGDAGAPVRLR
jgi:hypothetical protein